MEKKLENKSHPFQGILGDDFNPKLLSMTIRRNFKFLILWSFVAVSFAYIYLHYTPNIYKASATAMIKTENTARYINLDKIDLDNYQNISSEIEIIRSNTIMHRVIDTLKLLAPIYSKVDVPPSLTARMWQLRRKLEDLQDPNICVLP